MNTFKYGVVEDRHDPLEMGRVRVRIFGVHSGDRKNDIPIDSLPWSLVLQPNNASTTSGNLSQLVEGTWVLVMYMDENLQDPLVIGSIPSRFMGKPDYEGGFTDPFAVHPRWTDNPTGKSDISLIAKPKEWTEHPSYKNRGDQRVSKIARAKRYNASSVIPDKSGPDFTRSYWDEPELRSNQDSIYPYNAVKEYESGIIEEYDSTPNNERITETHPSGSYHEISADGSTTTKIVGQGYTITLKDHNMYIEGDLNVTVKGNYRQLVEGDYITEVLGDMTTIVRGDRIAKIESNDVKEIGINHSVNIRENVNTNIGNTNTLIVGEDDNIIVGNNLSATISGNENKLVSGSASHAIGSNHIIGVGNNYLLATGNNINLESIGAMSIVVESTIDINADDDISINGGPNIKLNT